MIVVDSSALIAILENEPEAPGFLELLSQSSGRFASAVTLYETGIVVGTRRGQDGVADLAELIQELRVVTVPFDEPQISAALAAYDRYGKGRRSRARLNLGDCVAYSLAKSMRARLLFKGDDFAHTDVMDDILPDEPPQR